MQKHTGCTVFIYHFVEVQLKTLLYFQPTSLSFSDQGDLNSHDLVIIMTSQLINMNFPREFESAITVTGTNHNNGNI